jgi:CDP-diacylglycerol pyrophosphatase
VRRTSRKRRAAALWIAGLVAALFAAAVWCANRDALREIVQDQCLVHWREQHSAAPCVEVHVDDPAPAGAGYAVLADRKGGAHFLLIPTQTVSGIESTVLTDPGGTGYFWAAWQAHDRLATVVGREVPRELVGLAVNPMHARSQDQLHIHIECLRPDVHAALARNAAHISASWSPLTLRDSSYWVRTIGADLKADDPFKLLATHFPVSDRAMGDYTLVVAGAPAEESTPPAGRSFFLLASTAAAGELLLDSTCAATNAAP